MILFGSRKDSPGVCHLIMHGLTIPKIRGIEDRRPAVMENLISRVES
ncbi:MAG TPA: hypothetical protein HA264_00520 [Methanolinea sp.]|nr:hypothetical protein [Methanolinea sp.]